MTETKSFSADEIEAALLNQLAACPPGKSISPSEPAVALAGHAGDAWGAVMPALRRVVVKLAKEGRLVIYRKGKPADPDDFKGVYRIGPVRQD